MIEIGLIGYGSFGQFICAHLKAHAELSVWDRSPKKLGAGIRSGTLAAVAAKPIVILAVAVGALEQILPSIAPYIQPGALVLDVSSVKLLPIELMQRYLPADCEILATHPLFGPESGQKGITGFKIVLWPVRLKPPRYELVRQFITFKLGLRIVEVEPSEHDQAMAYVQGLTFFIGEALKALQLPDEDLTTATYQHLLEIKYISERHSADLFKAIELANPYAAAVRTQLMAALAQIDRQL